MDEQRLAFSPAEAAERLGISERTMRTMIAQERVRVVRVGTRILIPVAVLRELLDGTAAPASAAR